MPTPDDQELIAYFASHEWPDTYYKFDAFTFTDNLQRYVKTNMVLLRYENQKARKALSRLKQKLEAETNGNQS